MRSSRSLLALLVACTVLPAATGCGAVTEAPASPPVSACLAAGAPRPAWQSTFAQGDFRDWTTWLRSDGGTFFVSSARRAKLPAPPACAGTHVAEFSVNRSQLMAGRLHSKLYKGWDVGAGRRRDDLSRPLSQLSRGGESGIYSAWFYIPRNYRARSRGPVNIFQFKEDYLAADEKGGAAFTSDVQSDLSIFNSATLKRWSNVRRPAAYDFGLRWDRPLLAVSLWHRPRVRPRRGHQAVAVPAPLGRWFNVSAQLYAGRRIAYFVDGRLLDTWYDDEYPVGIRYRQAIGWTFGVGHYGDNVGRLWVADASFTPFSRFATAGGR